jgi:type IV secretion system protein VirD4
MVSRQETARPLMTPGEVMQLPPDDEIVMVAGVPPIRAKKARYFEDRRLTERILPPPKPSDPKAQPKPDNWSALTPVRLPAPPADGGNGDDATAVSAAPSSVIQRNTDPVNAGIRREPGLERHKDIAPERSTSFSEEFEPDRNESDDDAVRVRTLGRSMRQVARQAAMDPRDGIEL